MNNTLLIIVAVIAIILLVTGGFVQSLQFLLWVGVVLLILAVILFLVRSLSGKKRL
jgi:Zn-dependent membrane protease YugP